MTHTTCAKDGCLKEPFARGYCGAHYQWARRTGVIQKIEWPASCKAPDCSQKVKLRGWCASHWSRIEKTGNPRLEVPINRRRTSGCAISGCVGDPVDGKFCWDHFHGLRHQHPDPARRKPGLPCTVDGCTTPSRFRGWCSRHYSRWQRHFDVLAHIPRQVFTDSDQCSQPRCVKTPYCKGMCRPHYNEHRRTGRVGLNPEPTAEQIKQRIDDERAYQRAFKAKEYQLDPERVRARHLAWKKANPESVKLADAKKRRRRRSSPQLSFTNAQLEAKIRYWGGKCWMCGAPWVAVDHVKPLSKGGWHALCNIRPACTPCNSRKKDQWPVPLASATVKPRLPA